MRSSALSGAAVHQQLNADRAGFVVEPTDAHLYSFGGAQSNAMLAIAQLASAKRAPFTYFSRGVSVASPSQPAGNLEAALALGMRHVPLAADEYHALVDSRDFARALDVGGVANNSSQTPLFIPQGGAFPKARYGVAKLAEEINDYVKADFPDSDVVVALPCGTGTTAFYLAQHVAPSVEVVAVPCVGDSDYLRLQFDQLAEADHATPSPHAIDPGRRPTILEPARKSRFGRLWRPLYDMYHQVLKETGIEIDLIYGAFVWHSLFTDDAVLDRLLSPPRQGGGPRELMYVHTGGVSGNASMLDRYERKQRQKLNID